MKAYRAPRAPGVRRRRALLAATVAAILAFLTVPGSSLAADVRLIPVSGGTGLQIIGDDSRTNDIRMAWVGPASTPPSTALEFILTDNLAMNAGAPCGFSASFYRCPSAGVTDYFVTLGTSAASSSIRNSFRFDGFDRGSVAGPLQRGSVGGSPGNDIITITAGQSNTVNGVGGSDAIRTFRNGQRDFVTCGPGSDDKAIVDLQDVIVDPQNCKTIGRAPADQHPVVEILGRSAKVAGGRAAVRLKCPKQATGKRCKGKLTLKKGKKKGKKVGSARYSLKKGKKQTVRVRVGGQRGTARAIATEGKKSNRKTAIRQLRLR